MKYWFIVGFVCVLHLQSIAGEIPQVPHHMEFAGMKLRISESARQEIQKQVNALRASDKYFKIKLDRVNLYFPIIEKIFKDAKLPDDFKYLAIQESALIGDAVSSANAVGYWQFKSFTGREVGLRIDDRVDERMNIVSASRGAAKYMKTNNFYYNNWVYALMAYNTGRGGARKYVKEELYGVSKMNIDKKTHWYVKTFLAHKIAFENEIGGQHSKGLKLVEYTKGGGKTLSKIAKDLDMDVEQIKKYNVWLRRGTIPEDKTYTVVLPVQGKLGKQAKDVIAKNEKKPTKTTESKSENVKVRTEKQYPKSLKAGLEHASEIYVKVNGIPTILARSEDTQEILASNGSIALHRFRKYNDLTEDDEIKPGYLYYLKPKKQFSKIPFHVVQNGEDLWTVSQKYGLKKKRLAKLNRIGQNDELKPGQVMWLNKKRPGNLPIEYRDPNPDFAVQPIAYVKKEPVKKEVVKIESSTNSDPEPVEPLPEVNLEEYDIHSVVAKETLYGISRKYNMSVDELIEVNRIDPYNMTIEIDQKLYVKKLPKEEIVIAKEEPDILKDTVTNEPKETTQELEEVKNNDNTTTVELKEIPEEVAEETVEKSSNSKKHVVQAGESLYGISRKYNVTVEELLKWNNLTLNDGINIDQELIIKESNKAVKQVQPEKETTSSSESDEQFHIVEPGDTLYSIARKYDVSIQDLIQWNKKSDAKINIGERIKVK